MYPLPKYFSLDHPLSFQATIRTETLAGGTRSETQISYPLTLGPAKQDWGTYALSVQRGVATHRGYSPNNADSLVQLLAQPLHHLEITFDQEGTPLKLRNHAAIWNHWQEETARVARAEFAGEWAEAMILKTEQRLFSGDDLLQNILQQDLILNTLLGLLPFSALGTDTALPFALSGVEIALPHHLHQGTDVAGNTLTELTATGPAPGGVAAWKKLLPKHKNAEALTDAPRIQKRCTYTLPADSLWPTGFSCKIEVAATENFRKSIYLQAGLL